MSSIIQQLKLWDQLIEQRIKFEELMHKCNSLPQEDIWSELSRSDKNGKLIKYQELAEEKLLNLFEECVQFEKTAEQLNPDLLEKDSLLKKQNVDHNKTEDKDMESDVEDRLDSDCEEGYESNLSDKQSDLDDEDENYDQQEYDEEENNHEKPFAEESYREFNDQSHLSDDNNNDELLEFRLNLNKDDLDETVQKTETYLLNRYNRLNAVRNDILNYWFEKTRFTLRGGKLDKNSLDAFEQSTVKSIDHLLLNRFKLIKRTQLKRGNYEIIGKPHTNEDEIMDSELVEKRKKEIYDEEIFDDSDFYHQLLRELVNSIGLTSVNNTKENPKWLKLMKERFKSNKYVDTKATKARKIRYKVHNELVNFMTPMTHLNKYDDEQHSNLIKSVFGQSTVSANANNDIDIDSDNTDSD